MESGLIDVKPYDIKTRLCAAALALALTLGMGAAPVWGNNSASSEEGTDWGDESSASSEASSRSSASSKPSSSAASSNYKEELNQLQSQYDSLAKQLEGVNAKIKELSKSQANQQELQKQIQVQMSLTEEQIKLLEQNIASTNRLIEAREAEIALKEAEIQDKEAEIADTDQLFRQRLRAIQISGAGSPLDILLGSGNFTAFLSQVVHMSRVAEHDQEMINQLWAQKATIEGIRTAILSAKQDLELDKQSLSADMQTLEQKREELNSQADQILAVIQELSHSQDELKEDQAEIKRQLEEIENELVRIIKENSSQNTEYIGGEMAWPLPGYTKITSYFGAREIGGKQDNHTGIDISGSGCHGASIVAANTGTVIAVRSYTSGYGIHLIIDHGGGTTTVYAHCSSVVVSEGDVVAKGQTVAKVGSTGWSTGPHLHFEVRIGGKAVNPLSYLKG